MGMGTNIIVFTFILSWAFWVFLGYAPLIVNFAGCFQNPQNPIVRVNSTGEISTDITATSARCPLDINIFGAQYTFYTLVLLLLGIGGLATILASTGLFPNPYTLFAGAAMFLFGLITFPVDLLFSDRTIIPNEIKILLASLFMLCYFVAFLLFYRQGGGSSW